MKRLSTCCFTGYRLNHLPYGRDETHPLCEDLKCVFAEEIDKAALAGYTHFISGVAYGTEIWFAEVVLFVQRLRPAITLECFVPDGKLYECMKRGGNKRRAEIFRRCDTLSMHDSTGSNRSPYESSRYIVDRSSLLIGACNGLPGISRYLTGYAHERGLNIVLIDPANPRHIIRNMLR